MNAHSPVSIRPSHRGVALVVVLSLIVLLTALVLAFMSSARNDLVISSHHEAGQQAQNLGETASDIVISQIREATLSGISGAGVGSHAWASQPGAIRVWDDTGALVQLYKLYSATQLKETSLTFLATEIPTDWRSRPDEYVDLNEPVAVNDGTSSVWQFPILNPAALGVVDGFSSAQSDDPGIDWNTQTSMPVHWLYVGRGGALSNSLQPDSIGRIAFWTDDETCKVNINTASAGTSKSTITRSPPGSNVAGSAASLGYSYWDRPYTQFVQDWNMSRSAPSQGEYQRYPGHPAGVNLLTVFSGSALTALSDSAQKTILQDVFDILPAYRWGGSENSRYPWTLARPISVSGTNERLYASVDELQFQASVSGVLRDTNSLPDGTGSDASRLDSLRFFLTAHSRAPDLNLFGQPRVTIWPLHDTDDILHRTTQDKLIAFCSTYGSGAGKKEFFFARKNALSQTEDWTGIGRNRSLFAYLRTMTSRAIPGFGGNFENKYDSASGGVSGERDQILTEIFDYIRCANLNETFEFKPAGFQSYTPSIDVPPSSQGGQAYKNWNDLNYNSFAGAGMVLPILINTYSTRGAGRVPVLSEVAIFAMQQFTIFPDPPPPDPPLPPEPKNEIQTALFFETFSPMQGYMPWTPKAFQLQVTSDMLVQGEPVFPNAAAGATTNPFNRSIADNYPTAENNWIFGSRNQPIGGTDGFVWTMEPYPDYRIGVVLPYPFARDRSTAIPLPSPAPSPAKFDVSQSTLQAELIMGGVHYQTYDLSFDAASLIIPQEGPASSGGENIIKDWIVRTDSKGMKFGRSDVVHSIVPKDGDYRIIAYLQDVPSGFFRRHPDYGSEKNFAHSLRQGRNSGQWGTTDATGMADGTTNGSFVSLPAPPHKEKIPGTNDIYFWTDHPDIPPDITDLIAEGWTGDWDSGLGDFPDGAYLGKPDDGMRIAANSAGQSSGLYFGRGFGWYSGAGFYSPTQQMPSGVMFGSLPTGVKRTEAAYISGADNNARPWRTLLFCPNPALGSTHYGFDSPADSLLLDLFTMPVVEPFAISEPSSTAGRINLNYQILPFTSLERSTGLHAVLSSQRVTAIPDTKAQTRHGSAVITVQGAIQADTTRTRHRIDVPKTLEQFTDRFTAGDIFHSATEICSLYFVPEGETLASTPGWWNSHRITGDNLRERPYATTYPLLTTKSNTYTVHIQAQSLTPGTNTVTGEYRGSTMIERYVDPEDSRLSSTSNDPDTKSLEPLYRFRVIETKRFAP